LCVVTQGGFEQRVTLGWRQELGRFPGLWNGLQVVRDHVARQRHETTDPEVVEHRLHGSELRVDGRRRELFPGRDPRATSLPRAGWALAPGVEIVPEARQ